MSYLNWKQQKRTKKIIAFTLAACTVFVLIVVCLGLFYLTRRGISHVTSPSQSKIKRVNAPWDWQVYTNKTLGIEFMYPSHSRIIEGKEKALDDSIITVPQSIFVDVPIYCEFEDGYFIVEVTSLPPPPEFLKLLTDKQEIGGLQGRSNKDITWNVQTDGRNGWDMLIEHKGNYYLIKDETCQSDIGRKMQKSIRFL